MTILFWKMVSPPSIVVATLLQLCGISIFISQPQNQCSQIPLVANWLFGLALLLLLWNCELLPKRYLNVFPRLYTCVELLGTIFISELAMLFGWCRYKRIVHYQSYRLCSNWSWCGNLSLCLLTLLPTALLLLALAPTHCREFLVQLLWKLPRPEADECLLEVVRELSIYVKGLICFFQLKREDRLRAIRLFQLQAERRYQREHWQYWVQMYAESQAQFTSASELNRKLFILDKNLCQQLLFLTGLKSRCFVSSIETLRNPHLLWCLSFPLSLSLMWLLFVLFELFAKSIFLSPSISHFENPF